MPFFEDPSLYTHHARFHGVRLYCRFEDDMPVLAGTNKFFDLCLVLATWYHNFMLEPAAQMMAALSGQADYEPGFPIEIWPFEDDE
jgi:hypothetical protein